MSINRDTAAILLLQRLAKPRPAADPLADHGEDPVAALGALGGTAQLTLGQAGTANYQDELDQVASELEELESEGTSVLSVLDDAYPANLRLVYDWPLVLWIRGVLEESHSRSVAVVGTREASPQGLEQARLISRQLVDAGYVVFSGLASGIDTAAHTAALDAGGRTIAVIGTGLRHSFPKGECVSSAAAQL